jgi:hypothetical protein
MGLVLVIFWRSPRLKFPVILSEGLESKNRFSDKLIFGFLSVGSVCPHTAKLKKKQKISGNALIKNFV